MGVVSYVWVSLADFQMGYITKIFKLLKQSNSKKNTTFVFIRLYLIAKKQASDREYIYSKLERLIMLLKDW